MAADGRVSTPPMPPQPQGMTRKTSGSLHSESTEEEKNHVIKVLEHESKLYHFEKNFLKMMSQNQTSSQAGKHMAFKASSPIYSISENKPY